MNEEMEIQSGSLPALRHAGRKPNSKANKFRSMKGGEWIRVAIKEGENPDNVRARLTSNALKTLGKGKCTVRMLADGSGFVLIRLPYKDSSEAK